MRLSWYLLTFCLKLNKVQKKLKICFIYFFLAYDNYQNGDKVSEKQSLFFCIEHPV